MIFSFYIKGINVIIAQFPINQFRSIGWYNVALGIAVIFTQVLIFKGEGKCKRNSKHDTGTTNRSAEKALQHEKSSTSKLFSISVSPKFITSKELYTNIFLTSIICACTDQRAGKLKTMHFFQKQYTTVHGVV